MHPTSEFHFDTPDQQEDLRVDNTQAVKKEQDELQAVEVAFSRDDPENPQDGWSTSKRWRGALPVLRRRPLARVAGRLGGRRRVTCGLVLRVQCF